MIISSNYLLETRLSQDHGARIAEGLAMSKNNYDLSNHETIQFVVAQFARDKCGCAAVES